MRSVVLVILLMKTLSVFGQIDWQKRVSVKAEEMPLERVLELLEESHGIRFSYGFDNIENATRITLNLENRTFLELIQKICIQANITYVIIGDVIVFKRSGFAANTRESPIKSNSTQDSVGHHKRLSPSYDLSRHRQLLEELWSAKSATVPKQLDSLLQVKKVNATVPRVSKKARGIYLSFAYDVNQFNFHARMLDHQRYDIITNQGFAIGAYRAFSNRFYISFGAAWARKAFALNYNYLLIDPGDPFPIPSRTVVSLNYLELPITLGVRMVSIKRNSLWLAGGFNSAVLLKDKETTDYLNTGNPRTDFFINSDKTRLFSCSLGLIYSCSISNSWGIFVEPDIHLFSQSMNEIAMDSPSALFRAKAGIQFSF